MGMKQKVVDVRVMSIEKKDKVVASDGAGSCFRKFWVSNRFDFVAG